MKDLWKSLDEGCNTGEEESHPHPWNPKGAAPNST